MAPLHEPERDAIAAQYERWSFPEPIPDLARYRGRQGFDPALVHRIYWPDRDYPAPIDVLVAGCGTNQAAEIAFHNRSARVLGIDVSTASLEHERRLQARHGLANLELQRLPIEGAATLGRQFDLVIASGVLHHLADPVAGLRALARCLKRDGVVAIMLYARYGRFGNDLMRTFSEALGLKQDPASVALLKEVLRSLPAAHPSAAAYRLDPRNPRSDAMLVDLFLNARERSYTARDCLEFVEAGGLTFQRWFSNQQFHPEARFDPDSPIYRALAALDRADMWSAMECLTKPLDGRHGFVACRRDRPREHWAIDFAAPAFLDYVPSLAGDDVAFTANDDRTTTVRRHAAQLVLSHNPLALLKSANGRRSIRAIIDDVTPPDLAPLRRTEIDQLAQVLFRRLWACDIVDIRLQPNTAATTR